MAYAVTQGILNFKPHIMCTYIARYNKSWNFACVSEPDGGPFFFHEAKLRSKAVTKCFISPSNHRLKSENFHYA